VASSSELPVPFEAKTSVKAPLFYLALIMITVKVVAPQHLARQ
jgi:hypothetical protein